jgi:peptidoglycan/LPS O-acetylase OafA/YrhL
LNCRRRFLRSKLLAAGKKASHLDISFSSDNDRQAGWQAIGIIVITFLTFGFTTEIMSFLRGNTLALRTIENHVAALAIFFVFTRLHKLTNGAGSFLGKISYSIYLFHPVIFYPLFIFWFQSSSLRSAPHLFIFIAMLLTIGFSYFTFRFIEKPFIEMGRKNFSGDVPCVRLVVASKI